MHVLALACENIFWTFPSDQNSLHLLLWLPLVCSCVRHQGLWNRHGAEQKTRQGRLLSLLYSCYLHQTFSFKKIYIFMCTYLYTYIHAHIFILSSLSLLNNNTYFRYTSSFIITYVLPRLICEGLLNLKLKHLIKTYCAFQACLHGAKLEVELQSSSLLSTAVRKNGASLQMT